VAFFASPAVPFPRIPPCSAVVLCVSNVEAHILRLMLSCLSSSSPSIHPLFSRRVAMANNAFFGLVNIGFLLHLLPATIVSDTEQFVDSARA
jgi:hypothetical protein